MQNPHQAQILVPSLNGFDTMDFPILFLENQPKSQQQQQKESNFQQIRNLNLIPIKIVETLNFSLSKLNHILDFCQYLQQTKQLKKKIELEIKGTLIKEQKSQNFIQTLEYGLQRGHGLLGLYGLSHAHEFDHPFRLEAMADIPSLTLFKK